MIGELIRKARTSNKMTTEVLARKADITQSMVSRYETGKVIPTDEILERLSKALGIDAKSINRKQEVGEYFDQREFDRVMAKAKSLGIAEKKALLTFVKSFLKNRDAELLISNWTAK